MFVSLSQVLPAFLVTRVLGTVLKQSYVDIFMTWRPWALDSFAVGATASDLVAARIPSEFDVLA